MSSSARLQMTSLAFMFDDVPAPPWTMSTTNWSCSAPDRISSQAATMACARFAPRIPRSRLASAAACFTAASPTMSSVRCEIGTPLMGKFSTARWVCTP
jgi:hypothetical protein